MTVVISGVTCTLADRVRETSTTTGTGTYQLSGIVVGSAFRTFVAGVGSGNRCPYVATMGANWEVGIGLVTSGAPATLTRQVILSSSNAGSAVNWAAGTKDIRHGEVAALIDQIWARPSGLGALPIGAVETRGPSTFNGSQSALDFTSIASTARVIHIGWSNIARASLGSSLCVQLGDSGGVETTGYASALASIDVIGFAFYTTSSNAFLVSGFGGTSPVQYGEATLTMITNNPGFWTYQAMCNNQISGDDFIDHGTGAKSLTTTLDRIRVTNLGATNFTAGGTVTMQIIHGVP
jgi:hypothetical protein